MNRKIALSSLSIMGALLIMGGATFAAFTTQATLGLNTFATGSSELLIGNDSVGNGSGVGVPYAAVIDGVDFNGIVPGFTTTKYFWLKNNSSSGELEVKADLSNLGGSFHGTDGSLPDKMRVQFTCDTDDNGLATGNSSSGNFTVREWIDGGDALLETLGVNEGAGNATGMSDQDELLCMMTASLDVNAGNELVNSNISFNAIFNGSQVGSATPAPSATAVPTASPI